MKYQPKKLWHSPAFTPALQVLARTWPAGLIMGWDSLTVHFGDLAGGKGEPR